MNAHDAEIFFYGMAAGFAIEFLIQLVKATFKK